MVTTLRSGGKLPALPKGLPTPTAKPTTFVICVAAMQRRQKVESAIASPNEALIVEGVLVCAERLPQAPAVINAGADAAAIWITMKAA